MLVPQDECAVSPHVPVAGQSDSVRSVTGSEVVNRKGPGGGHADYRLFRRIPERWLGPMRSPAVGWRAIGRRATSVRGSSCRCRIVDSGAPL